VTAAIAKQGKGPASGRVPAPFHIVLPALALAALFAATPALAQDWPAEKCRRYAEAWDAASRHRGTTGLSRDFLDAHDAFIASGCRDRRACPRSQAEIAMADTMTVLALNAGMSGTFLPFICRP
jgi:hypothetical protein